MQKLIITCAIQGAEVSPDRQPALPLTPEQVALAAWEAREAGASILHLHVRDDRGQPTQDPEVFSRHMESIRARTDLIIQVSTGGAIGMSIEERAAPLALCPEMATLTTGSVNFGDGIFLNSAAEMEYLAAQMKRFNVRPEFEIFELGMVENAMQLVKKGLVQPPFHFDFVMGVPGGIPARVRHLIHLVESLPEGSSWSVAGIGRHELPLGVVAMVMGGHVRVGFEDNIYYSQGVLARSNAQLVERMARLARELGREVASPAETRAMLGIGRDGGRAV